MRKTYIYLLILIFTSCTRYYIKKIEQKPESFRKTVNKKIALVGFFPYKSRVINTEWRGIKRVKEYDTELILSDRFKKLVTYAKTVEKFPAKGYDDTVPVQKINYLIANYLNVTMKYGIAELSKMIEYKENTPRLKKRIVDYYVVGIHLPLLAGSTSTYLSRLACVTGVFTLGILPLYDTHPVASVFMVFDNKLNPVKLFKYEDEYTSLTAWWMIPNLEGDYGRCPPPDVWESQVIKFSNDFYKYLHKKKQI